VTRLVQQDRLQMAARHYLGMYRVNLLMCQYPPA